MRIAIFTNTYWPTMNGVAVSIANLREGLHELGHEVVIFAPAPRGFDHQEDEPGIFRFPAFAAPVAADYQIALPPVPFALPIWRFLRRERFDLVHTHHPLWVGVWGQRYARQRGLPLVTTIHTQYEVYSSLLPLPGSWIRQYLRRQVRRYCERCDLVTTPAESSRQRLLQLGVTTPIEVIYNPTDLSALWEADGSEIRRQYGCGAEDLLVGFIGRLAPEKNLNTLLEAAAIFLPQVPRARLLFVGDGPSRPHLERQAEVLPVRERIFFAGRVPHEQIPQYCAALDLFITPSLSEVQPVSFAEAMAAGTPLLAMNAPGAKDMIEDGVNGRLVPPEEGAMGLARVAFELLHNRAALRAYGERAREWARRYERGRVVQAMLEAYEKARVRHATRGR